MDDATHGDLLKLAVRVRDSLSRVPDDDRELMKRGRAQRLAEAESAAKTLLSDGVPSDAAACWRLERALFGGIEVLRWLTTEETVAYRLTDAWALLRDDMTRCRFNAKARVIQNPTLEEKGTSSDDEPVN